jgi:hypothetical protein
VGLEVEASVRLGGMMISFRPQIERDFKDESCSDEMMHGKSVEKSGFGESIGFYSMKTTKTRVAGEYLHVTAGCCKGDVRHREFGSGN